MRRLLSICLFLLVASGLGSSQTPSNGSYDWPSVTGTGPNGQYLIQFHDNVFPPRAYTISWTVSGTTPSVCTFRVEGSDDGVNWFGLDATAPAADSLPCSIANMISIADRPSRMVRVNLITYTAGDSTTKVIFHYTKGL